jgi:hypothetical protein
MTTASPYDARFRGGVSVATGMLEEGGRISLVTGAGPGKLAAPKVNGYNFDLFGRAASRSFPDVRKRLHPKRVVAFDGARSHSTGVAVATGNPYAASGGFSNVLTTPTSGTSRLRIFTIAQKMEHMHGSDFSVSGVTRPHDYQPTSPRTARRVDEVSLGEPADVTAISTQTGARLLVVARAGGAVAQWASKLGILPKPGQRTTIKLKKELPASGSRVSGI